MRELKFRLRDRQVKFRAYLWSDKHTNDQWIYWEDGVINFWNAYLHWEADKSLMQFTGLLDKQSKEIYEADILKTSTGNYPVIWDNDGLWGFDDRHPLYFSDINQREVIGNIYSNPELLAVAKYTIYCDR